MTEKAMMIIHAMFTNVALETDHTQEVFLDCEAIHFDHLKVQGSPEAILSQRSSSNGLTTAPPAREIPMQGTH